MDGYSNAIFRLLRNLKVPAKGLVGPWAHKYPHFAKPGPQIGFLQEALRWWDHWLKGRDTGIMDEPILRAWINDAAEPLAHVDCQDGRWITEPTWPSNNVKMRRWALRPGELAEEPGSETMRISSPATVGLASGDWSPSGLGFDLPTDQRIEACGSLVFDSAVLTESLEILGAPMAALTLAADQPQAQVACVLSEVRASGSVTRVSYAVLNLAHRDSHADPTPLEPSRAYRIRLRLNEAGHRFMPGSRIRVAVSSAYWPIVWPAPLPVTLTLGADSCVELPVRRETGVPPPSFPPSDAAPALRKAVLRPGREGRRVETDIVTGVVTKVAEIDLGEWRIEDIDLTLTNDSGSRLAIHPEDPTSARHETWWERTFERADWRVRMKGRMAMTSDHENFHLSATVEAFEGHTCLFRRDWNVLIARDNL